MVKICAEITEKTSKWKKFNVQLAVDEYNREQEVKDLEKETSLLEVVVSCLISFIQL